MADKQKIRVGRLNTVGNCRHELARVYRCARREELDSLDASRLATILKIICDAIRSTEIEERLEALEAKIDEH